MKKILLFLCFCTASFADLVPPTLLEHLGLSPDLTDQEVFELTQTHWFQNKERWEFEPNLEDKRQELEPIFRTMGYLEEQLPKATHYDYALVIGSTAWSQQKRISHLETLIQNGLKVDQIVFLSGQRPLLEKEKQSLPSPAETEWDMVQQLYENSTLPRSIPITFVNAPMDGPRRPGTLDTITLWQQSKPKPGTCLIITTQPYLPFHEALLPHVLPFPCDLTSEKASETWTVALILDTIARKLKASCPY